MNAGVLALDHRLIRLKELPDGFQTELIGTSERSQTGRGEDRPDYTLDCEEPSNAPSTLACAGV